MIAKEAAYLDVKNIIILNDMRRGIIIIFDVVKAKKAHIRIIEATDKEKIPLRRTIIENMSKRKRYILSMGIILILEVAYISEAIYTTPIIM